jgi:FkbM family methyltransferase
MRAPPGLHLRDVKVEGLGPWVWVEDDHWAFNHPAPEFAGLRDLVLAHTPEPRVIIQAGGCMGMYPRLWAEHFATVYTFEPDPLNFYCLVANCPQDNVVKLQAALSDKPRMGALHMGPATNCGAHWLSASAGTVPVLALDSFAFERVDAIQLDCEGHEPHVVAGAWETIRRHRPTIAIEAPNAALRARLQSIGYGEMGRAGSMPDVVFATPETQS